MMLFFFFVNLYLTIFAADNKEKLDLGTKGQVAMGPCMEIDATLKRQLQDDEESRPSKTSKIITAHFSINFVLIDLNFFILLSRPSCGSSFIVVRTRIKEALM